MRDHLLEVVENSRLSERVYLLRLKGFTEGVRGGQFVMLEVSGTHDPVIRRAFAVADVKGDELFLFYEVVGRGTREMSSWRPGRVVRVLGPLGKGHFRTEGNRHLLVGGGIGVAGLTLFGKELKSKGKEVFFAYGVRTSRDLALLGWLKEEGFDLCVYTEDGSAGRRGSVPEVLKDFDSGWTVSACGPRGMLRTLKRLTEETGHRLYVSLDARMGCGWGVCLGCVVRNRKGEFVRVCYEGPVFPAEEVVL